MTCKKHINKSTHLLKLIVPGSPRPAPCGRRGARSALLTAAGGAHVGAVGCAGGGGPLLGRLLRRPAGLEHLVLGQQLGGQVLVLVGELADAVLGHPVVPAALPALVV